MENSLEVEVKRNRSRCSIHLTLFTLDVVFLLVVIVFQGSLLNYYIIFNDKKSLGAYFWFLWDIGTLFLFLAALTIAYGNQRRAKKRKESPPRNPSLEKWFPVRYFGTTPLCYMTWLIYIFTLVAKLWVLFKSDHIRNLEVKETFGPNLLLVGITVTVIVFALFVEGHHSISHFSPRGLFITVCISMSSFEILDSITFLSILFVKESGIILSEHLVNVILLLTSINLTLPSLALYKLSVCDYGNKEFNTLLLVLYKLMHLILVNVPFFAVRVYLWSAHDHSISVFIVKNILAIIITLRTIFPDTKKLIKENCLRRQKVYDKDRVDNHMVEMDELRTCGEPVKPAVDGFEEIALHEQDNTPQVV